MGRIEIGGIQVRDQKDIKKILGQSEKEFARLISSKPHLQCWYESTRFEYQNGGPHPESTVPDFRILNTLTGVEIFVEITTSLLEPNADPKEKQKRVMKNVLNNEDTVFRYVVLYAENLLKIQAANSDYKFLSHAHLKRPKKKEK